MQIINFGGTSFAFFFFSSVWGTSKFPFPPKKCKIEPFPFHAWLHLLCLQIVSIRAVSWIVSKFWKWLTRLFELLYQIQVSGPNFIHKLSRKHAAQFDKAENRQAATWVPEKSYCVSCTTGFKKNANEITSRLYKLAEIVFFSSTKTSQRNVYEK